MPKQRQTKQKKSKPPTKPAKQAKRASEQSKPAKAKPSRQPKPARLAKALKREKKKQGKKARVELKRSSARGKKSDRSDRKDRSRDDAVCEQLPDHLDQLGLGHGAPFFEARDVENCECFVGRLPEHGVREDPRDRRRDHEAVPAEAGRDVEPVLDAAEEGLVIRSDVVLALDQYREGDVRERGHQLLDSRMHRRAPCLLLRLVASRPQVAREHAPVS